MECPLAKDMVTIFWGKTILISQNSFPNLQARVILEWLSDFVPDYVLKSGRQQREWVLLNGLLYFAIINL